MGNKALMIIDIQNDITKNYKKIIDRINQAIDWAVTENMQIIYIKHNNLSPGTRTFKPDTKGAELVPEMKVVSDNIFVKTKANALTSEVFTEWMKCTHTMRKRAVRSKNLRIIWRALIVRWTIV